MERGRRKRPTGAGRPIPPPAGSIPYGVFARLAIANPQTEAGGARQAAPDMAAPPPSPVVFRPQPLARFGPPATYMGARINQFP